MSIYFINSDAVSNNRRSYHSVWIDRGIAVTSGGSKYREQIDGIPKGSTLILHGKGFGVVAAGTILDKHSVSVLKGAETVSPLEAEEFHREVAWFADLRKNPLPYKEVIRVWGYESTSGGAPDSIQRVGPNRFNTSLRRTSRYSSNLQPPICQTDAGHGASASAARTRSISPRPAEIVARTVRRHGLCISRSNKGVACATVVLVN